MTLVPHAHTLEVKGVNPMATVRLICENCLKPNMTHLCHSTIQFAVMHNAAFLQRCGREPMRRRR